MIRPALPLTSLCFIACLGLSACSPQDSSSTGDCLGDKCDTPTDLTPTQACELREADALESSQRAFTRDAIRWACSDVEGVNTNGVDSRGQEYCEYFAIVSPPGQEPVMLGRQGDQLGINLDDEQIFELEDNPDSIVGQCVFTTWHSDIDRELECTDVGCPEVMGFALSEDFKMKGGLNSNGAAQLLMKDCLAPGPTADAANPDDPLHGDYYRGCMRCGELSERGACIYWRRSDPSVCAAAMRLAECGCGIDLNQDGVADEGVDPVTTILPSKSAANAPRGFPLGTWSNANGLPAGCKYGEVGDGSQTIVTCDIRAGELINVAGDPKGLCRSKYGDNVVVHVPVPADKIVCSPDPAANCSAEPWLIDR